MGGSDVPGIPYRSYNLCPTDFALGLYEQGDSRWAATFMTEVQSNYYNYFSTSAPLAITHFYAPKWFTSTDSTAYMLANPGANYHKYGTYGAGVVSSDWQTIPVKKFDDPKSPFTNKSGSTRDIILGRLGETYLLAAEAYLKAGNSATALARLNVVRTRAGVANATAIDIDYILDERGRELLGEYHRWFDLKRTGKLIERAVAHHYRITSAANFNGANGELKILRPIPQEAIDLNQNKNFPQNPAYN